jgi:predicted transcriptional regulator
MPEAATSNLVELASDIVSAYVSNNSVQTSELPALIAEVHASLASISSGGQQAPEQPLVPAVPVKKSVQPDYIVCLEDGKKFKSLPETSQELAPTRCSLSPRRRPAGARLPPAEPSREPGCRRSFYASERKAAMRDAACAMWSTPLR